MTEFSIIAEGHEGVCSIEETVLDVIAAETREEALRRFWCARDPFSPWADREVLAVNLSAGETFDSVAATQRDAERRAWLKVNLPLIYAGEKLKSGAAAEQRMAEQYGPEWRSLADRRAYPIGFASS